MKKAVQRQSPWPLLMIFLVFLMFPGTGLYQVYSNHLFASQAISVMGTIVDRNIQEVSSGRSGHRKQYLLSYTYPVGSFTYRVWKEVLPSTYLSQPQGSVIPVRVLSDHPGKSRIDSLMERESFRRQPRTPLMYGALLVGVILIVIAQLLVNNRTYAGLVRRGTACLGRVTSVTSEIRGRNRVNVISFTFTDNLGHEICGTASQALTEQRTWQEGDALQLYYDPKSNRFAVDLEKQLNSLLR